MTRSRQHITGLAMCTAILLSGCDSTKKALGMTKAIPDEHTVMERAPLTVPKDLYSLHPPKAGDAEKAYQKVRADREANAGELKKVSGAEKSLMEKADVNERDPNIRKALSQPGTK
jgi:uncharacterized lipoprotein